MPSGYYEVAVFENRFPSLSLDPGPPPPIADVETAPGRGSCEVVVFCKTGRSAWETCRSIAFR
jgi:UDPglucose--hexose-1-phosphate uridylyltransferase